MANELVRLLNGLEANLPQTITPGDILFAKDTGKLFIDTILNNQDVRIPVRTSADNSVFVKYIGYPTRGTGYVNSFPIYEVSVYDFATMEEVDPSEVFSNGEIINIIITEQNLPTCYFHFNKGTFIDKYFEAVAPYTFSDDTSALALIVIYDEPEVIDDKTIGGLCWYLSTIPEEFKTGAVNQATGLTIEKGVKGLLPEFPINSPTNLILTGEGWVQNSMAWQTF